MQGFSYCKPERTITNTGPERIFDMQPWYLGRHTAHQRSSLHVFNVRIRFQL